MEATVMNDEVLMQKAPAIFADKPSDRMSDRYKFIPTIEYVNALREKNWNVVSARQPISRRSDPNTQKHIVTLVHSDMDYRKAELGHIRPQISLLNSHNGTTQIEGTVSFSVKVCGNGLYVSRGDFDGFRFRHDANAKEVAMVLSDDFFQRIDPLIESFSRWQEIETTDDLELEYATYARDLRFGNDSIVAPRDLLQSRRIDDNQNTLWKLFNRVQENVMKGGIKLRPGVEKKSRGRQQSGQITNISVEVDLNKQLWDRASNMAKMITG